MTDATKIDRDALAAAIAVAQNVPFVGPKQKTIADAVIAHLSTLPVEPEVEEVDPEPWVHPTHGRAHMPHAGTGWLHAPRKVVPHE